MVTGDVQGAAAALLSALDRLASDEGWSSFAVLAGDEVTRALDSWASTADASALAEASSGLLRIADELQTLTRPHRDAVLIRHEQQLVLLDLRLQLRVLQRPATSDSARL